MSRVVSVIPAKPMQVIRGLDIAAKKRVCAYCRVSTDTEEYIKNRPEWEFAGIYADEGITGTNTKKRTDFHRMIDDCLLGKIDMIITNSISRFARNTLDCLQYVRMLKDKGIGVYFEKENIDTLDAKGEVLLTILVRLPRMSPAPLAKTPGGALCGAFSKARYGSITEIYGL
jgi:hypothetical protein